MRTYALLVAGKTDYLGQFLPINTSLRIMEAFRDGGLKSSLLITGEKTKWYEE